MSAGKQLVAKFVTAEISTIIRIVDSAEKSHPRRLTKIVIAATTGKW